MKKVCLTTFVYGDKYHSYIPFLVYSCAKAYPEYDIHLFVYGRLGEKIREQLDFINSGTVIRIYEDAYSNFSKMNSLTSKSIRWLLWSDFFQDYDYLYIVDIDILYIKEKIPLHEQHIKHMELLKLPFSNIKRKFEYNPYKKFVMVFQTMKYFGILRAIKMLMVPNRVEYKLSGLHFVDIKKYFKKLNPQIIEKELLLLSRGKFPQSIIYPNNEIFLFKLLEKVGFDLSVLATQSDNGVRMLDPNPDRLEFRPEHGIHLGMFGSNEIPLYNLEILASSTYKFYIEEYKEKMLNDEKFIQLIRMAPDFIKVTFDNFHKFCGFPLVR